MTINDAATIMKILKIAYPHFYKDLSKDEAKQTIELWAMMFENDELKIVVEAVKATIINNKYPPTIADIKEKIALIQQKITGETELTEQEAWTMVRNAISYYSASEQFEKLPNMLQKLVGSPNQLREWALMDAENINTVVSSNFMRSYKARVKQHKQMQQLPNSTKQMIQELSKNMKMIEEG